MSLFLGGTFHIKPLNSSHTSVFHLALFGCLFAQLPITTPGEVKPITGPVRAWRSAYLTSTSGGSQSCFGLLILALASRAKHALSKLKALTRPFSTRISFPRSLSIRTSPITRITSPEHVGIQARSGSSLASAKPVLLSRCVRTPRISLLHFVKTHLSRTICLVITNPDTMQEAIPQMMTNVLAASLSANVRWSVITEVDERTFSMNLAKIITPNYVTTLLRSAVTATRPDFQNFTASICTDPSSAHGARI